MPYVKEDQDNENVRLLTKRLFEWCGMIYDKIDKIHLMISQPHTNQLALLITCCMFYYHMTYQYNISALLHTVKVRATNHNWYLIDESHYDVEFQLHKWWSFMKEQLRNLYRIRFVDKIWFYCFVFITVFIYVSFVGSNSLGLAVLCSLYKSA